MRIGTDNYLNGAKNHLKFALPYRLNFIAAKSGSDVTIGDPVFDAVITQHAQLQTLTPEELVQFMRDFHLNDKVQKFLHPNLFDTSQRNIGIFIGQYDKIRGIEGKDAANAYISRKRGSIINTFKPLMANLMAAIAGKKK